MERDKENVKIVDDATHAGQERPLTQNIIINKVGANGLGIAGFVIALIALCLCWVPVVNWVSWILGLIFSALGLIKKPRGLAIAGLIISVIGIVLMVLFVGFVAYNMK